MSNVWIHPRCAADFKELKLASPGDFLRLEGPIVGGHPDRHVRRVELIREQGAPLTGFLKREHRIRWRDRIRNFLNGYGWVSKSAREARILLEATRAGIGCPTVLAYGEAEGQAFLLVENMDMADLRKYARAFPRQRRLVARALGRELARLHTAGFRHPELYAKHVLIRQDDSGYRFAFLDWQLARSGVKLTLAQRCRDLAALHATLADELACPTTRLLFLHSYREEANVDLPAITRLARMVERVTQPLLAKRRIRELRQMPLPRMAQDLVWMEGEALCVTLEFSKELAGRVPSWLRPPEPPQQWPHYQEQVLPFDGRSLHLTQRWFSPPLLSALPVLRRTAYAAPEFALAAAHIRLRRFGVRTPRLLAMGHREVPGMGKYSFLLTEPSAEARPLQGVPEQGEEQHRFLTLLGGLLRRIHEAGYALKEPSFGTHVHLGLADEWGDEPELVLLRLDGLERSEVPLPRRLRRDLEMVLDGSPMGLAETALAELVRAYAGRRRWTAEAETMMDNLLDLCTPRERQVV